MRTLITPKSGLMIALLGCGSACGQPPPETITAGQPVPAVVHVRLALNQQGRCQASLPATDKPTLEKGQSLFWIVTNDCTDRESHNVRIFVVRNQNPDGQDKPGDEPYQGARGGRTVMVKRGEAESVNARIHDTKPNDSPNRACTYKYNIDVLQGAPLDPEIVVDWP